MRKSERDKQIEWVAENVFTPAEAAEYTGMSRQAIWQAERYGRLDIIKGKFILKSDLDDLKANDKRLKANKK